MTQRTCPLCDARLLDAAYIDTGCARLAASRLRAVPGLLNELDTTLTGLGSTWSDPGDGSHGTTPSISLDERAAAAAAQLRAVVHLWAQTWDRGRPITGVPALAPAGPLCDDWHGCSHPSCDQIVRYRLRAARDRALATATGQAQLLASQPLTGYPWAPELAGQLQLAVRAAEHAIDLPPELDLAGTCGCGMAVYVHTGDDTARCRWCGTDHDVRHLHEAMLAAKASIVAPAAMIARVLVDPLTRRPLVSASQIRNWRARGALDVALINDAGQPCYSLAAVAQLAKNGASTPITGQPAAAAG